MKRLLLLATLVAGVACMEDRVRLSPPRVTLIVTQTTVPAGSSVSGTISAGDESGIVYVGIRVRIEGDTEDPDGGFWNVPGSDTIHYAFSIPIKTGFPSGTPIYVTATVQDDENFVVTREDTIAVR